jgi:hypothetical protein
MVAVMAFVVDSERQIGIRWQRWGGLNFPGFDTNRQN